MKQVRDEWGTEQVGNRKRLGESDAKQDSRNDDAGAGGSAAAR
jgi:hypothetical protein